MMLMQGSGTLQLSLTASPNSSTIPHAFRLTEGVGLQLLQGVQSELSRLGYKNTWTEGWPHNNLRRIRVKLVEFGPCGQDATVRHYCKHRTRNVSGDSQFSDAADIYSRTVVALSS